jgi:phage baseplate assembly protein W
VPGTSATASPGFPFALDATGHIRRSAGAAQTRERILQLLFTSPGERVHQPEFGCGLLTMVFEPSDPVVAAAIEFTIGQALVRWLGREILVDTVDVTASGDTVTVEVSWRQREDSSPHAVRAQLGGSSG